MTKLKPGMRIKCNSEDEAKEFIKLAYKQGFKWNDSSKDDVTAWSNLNKHIIYNLHKEMAITFSINTIFREDLIDYSDLKKGEYATMTKSDLENGMVVETRDVDRGLIINNTIIYTTGYDYLHEYNDNLTNKQFTELDIVKIYKSKLISTATIFDDDKLELIWERDKEQKLSKKDKKVIKKGLKKAQEYCNSLISCKGCEFREGAYCKFDCFSMSTDLDEFFKD